SSVSFLAQAPNRGDLLASAVARRRAKRVAGTEATLRGGRCGRRRTSLLVRSGLPAYADEAHAPLRPHQRPPPLHASMQIVDLQAGGFLVEQDLPRRSEARRRRPGAFARAALDGNPEHRGFERELHEEAFERLQVE